MNLRVLINLLGLLVVPLSIQTARASNLSEIYVALEGNDSNAGSKAKPLATLERARDTLRKLKHDGKIGQNGAIILLRRGDYFRTNALELSTQDSGTVQAPILWRAFPNETVRILGGRKLTGFEKVKDAAILGRLPTEARPHVLQVNLRALQINDFGEMKSRGFGRPIQPAHCELFFGGKPMTLARWPNEGAWEKITGFPEANAQNDGHGGSIGKLEEGFSYAGDRPQRWKESSDWWVHGYWSWDWANSYERVISVDPGKRLVKTASPYGQYGFRKGQRFYFLNILEELDQPGEWFLDWTSGWLYFWPPEEGQNPTETVLSLLAEPLIKLTDVSNVTLQGLTLEAARGTAVDIHGGSSNLVAGCVIRNLGNYGINISGGQGNGVRSCDIFDTGDGGVSLSGGNRITLEAGGHFVENCHFARQGRWSKCYVPAVLMEGVGLRVSHNLIQDHPHCAILFGGNNHLIELNEIHHIALETGDVGAIYTGRDYTFRGNRIRYNFIHHTGGVGMGSMGIYMDDCVSGTEIFGNVFYQVQRAAFLGGGRDHQVINNIFVNCDHAVELDGRGLDTSPMWHDMVDQTMRQGLTNAPLNLYRERYPAMKTLDQYYGPPEGAAVTGPAFKGVPPDGNVVARNVCVGKWLNVYWHAKTEMLRLENNLTNAADSFIAMPLGNKAKEFQIKADSPAWKLGFEPIPLATIGLLPDELRKNLASTRP